MGLRSAFADTRPLRHNDFRRLWTANIVTVVGGQLSVVTVPAQIFEITRSSAMVGLTGAFGLVPLVLFGLWGGALADAMDRRRLLLITTIGLILTSGLFALHAFSGWNNVWLLLLIFTMQQAFLAVNQPTRSAVLPRILPLELLPAANSLNMTVMMFGAIAGPMLAGPLIPLIGYGWLYLVDSLGLLTTLWAVLRLPPLAPTGARQGSGVRAIVGGFKYLRHHKVLLMSFVVDIIAMVFGMPRALFPQIAHEGFGDPIGGGLAFSLLFAAIPIGSVAGGVFSGWVSNVTRQGRAVVCSIFGWGASMAGFGVAVGLARGTALPWLPLAVAMLIAGGAADMASAAFRSTMLQEAASDDVRGRLQGVFTVVVAGGPRLADLAHGSAAALVGTSAASTGGGILVLALTAVAAIAAPIFWRYRVVRDR